MSVSPSQGSIITFYSWKGGVGRTMALANVAVQLARRGRKVLMVDWDLEAPGLVRYFTGKEATETAKVKVAAPINDTGLLGLFHDAFESGASKPESAEWQDRLHRLTVPPMDGRLRRPYSPTPGELHLLASGLGSMDYGPRLAAFSWGRFFGERQGGAWIEALRGQWAQTYDFVLLDSRTGLTDSGGVCTVQMPDILVLVFTSNDQSLEDGLRMVGAVQMSRKGFAYDRPPVTVVPLLSRWDGDDEVDLGDRWMGRIDDVLKPITAAWLPEEFTPRAFVEKVRVPHVARFSFGEPLPVLTHSLTDTNLPGLAYETLARLLDSRLSDAGQIIDPSYRPPHFTAGYSQESDLKLLALVQDGPALHREIARLAKAYSSESSKVAEFLNEAGQKLSEIGRLEEAEPLMRRALAIDEHAYGAEHPKVAIQLNNLATLLKDTNRLAEAEPLMRRALAIDEHAYGAEHPRVSIDLNNLATLLQASNRLAEAEPLYRRALGIDEQSYGAEHPRVSADLNNLATLLNDTNRLAEAEPLMRRSLAIDERSYGAEDPNVAIRLNNLAALLKETNRLAEAEPLMRRSLAIVEQSYGAEHPRVSVNLNNLAALLQATSRLAEAEPLMRRALAIDEQAYGAEHPKVAIRLNNLATLLRDTNRLSEAEPLMRRHLDIFLKFTVSTGHNHPHLEAAVSNYADLLTLMGSSQEQALAQLNDLARPYGIKLSGGA
jgi:tetratricopeptide (TPR) repeat protein